MLYLDDLAVWVKTQKGSIVRGVSCGLFLLIAVFIGFKAVNEKPALEQTIADNDIKISDLNYKLSQIQTQIDNYGQITGTPFTPADIGDPVAVAQTDYCRDYSMLRDDNRIGTFNEIQNRITQYCTSGTNINSWYDRPNSLGQWDLLNSQTYLVNENSNSNIGGVFECIVPFRDNMYHSNTVAVVFCDFNSKTNKIENLRYYETRVGSNYRNVYNIADAITNTNDTNDTKDDISIVGIFDFDANMYSEYIKPQHDDEQTDENTDEQVDVDSEEQSGDDKQPAGQDVTEDKDDTSDDSSNGVIDSILGNVGGNK